MMGGCPRVLEVARPKGARRRSPGLERALELLLECQAGRLRVELEGPWPEDPDAWLSPLEAAAEQALREGKEFACSIRRGGSLPARTADRLSALGAQVVLEVRPGEGDCGWLRGRLAEFDRLGVQAVIEAALGPGDRERLRAGLEGLEALSPARVRFTALAGMSGPGGRPLVPAHSARGLAGGPLGADAAAAVESELKRWLEGLLLRGRDRPPALEVLNFCEEEEPELLASGLRLTPEGAVGWATALRHADIWPKLLEACPPVPIGRLKSLEGLFLEPARRQRWAAGVLSGPGQELWLDSAGFALRLRRFFQRPFQGFRDRSENKALRRGLIQANLAEQDRFLRLRLPGVESVFLFLRSGCLHDCIFCKHKADGPGQSLKELEAILKGNLRVRRKSIALVGNEPLLHPRIVEVVRLCRRYGFSEIEVMTSGTLLSDMARARELREAGATAFAIPLYSAEPAEHDALTRREGSFRQAVEGIENLGRLGARVFVHSNLMRQNLRALGRLEGLVARDWRLPFSILCLRPKDPGGMNLPYRDIEPSYRETLAAGLKVGSLVGFPVCVQRRIQGEAACGPGRLADGIKLYLLHQDFVKPSSCLGCRDSRRCLGTFRDHLELYPGDLSLLSARGGCQPPARTALMPQARRFP